MKEWRYLSRIVISLSDGDGIVVLRGRRDVAVVEAGAQNLPGITQHEQPAFSVGASRRFSCACVFPSAYADNLYRSTFKDVMRSSAQGIVVDSIATNISGLQGAKSRMRRLTPRNHDIFS